MLVWHFTKRILQLCVSLVNKWAIIYVRGTWTGSAGSISGEDWGLAVLSLLLSLPPLHATPWTCNRHPHASTSTLTDTHPTGVLHKKKWVNNPKVLQQSLWSYYFTNNSICQKCKLVVDPFERVFILYWK